ncbi:MAG: glycerate kinase [Spirochaetaceae bacterium]
MSGNEKLDETAGERLRAIVDAALARVDSAEIIRRCVRRDGATLTVKTETEELTLDLDGFERVVVVSIGKAAARMARALETVLDERLTGGVVVTKYGHGEALARLEAFEAGHPVPDEAGVRAARQVEEVVTEAREGTLLISLISGGGSALLVDPYHDGTHELTLSDLQEVTRLLLGCGATIQEMNCLRKHLSAVKGGRLAALAAPATTLSLILSDVVGDDTASIASGITAPDPSTFAEAVEIARRHDIFSSFPPRVRQLLEEGVAGTVPETPGPEDPLFDRVRNLIVGSNAQALRAAAEAARAAGYRTIILTSGLVGEARETAKLFPAIARDVLREALLTQAPACILAGGETTVTLGPRPGRGGRNQELALAALRELLVGPTEHRLGITFASVATDGNDGPTDAAGGYFDAAVVARAREDVSGLHRALAENDSYGYLERIGGLLRTGPTNTNVCDIQVLLVES